MGLHPSASERASLVKTATAVGLPEAVQPAPTNGGLEALSALYEAREARGGRPGSSGRRPGERRRRPVALDRGGRLFKRLFEQSQDPMTPKRRVYEHLSRIGKAVSAPSRLELLEILAQGERTVEALAKETSLSVANTSHHLQVLRESGLVEARKEGLYVHYRLAGDDVDELARLVRTIGERRLAEVAAVVKRYFTSRDELEPVKREVLLERARAGTVLVLDVRPAEEYRAGHIPGAVSIPLGELGRRIDELPADKDVVAYCRGPYCVLAFRAVEVLRGRGRAARRLEEGLPEWRAAGLSVAVSNEEEDE
jgi:rhodanese-related sulfurtransferase/DNA-binding transcriptional ArsR family regulator